MKSTLFKLYFPWTRPKALRSCKKKFQRVPASGSQAGIRRRSLPDLIGWPTVSSKNLGVTNPNSSSSSTVFQEARQCSVIRRRCGSSGNSGKRSVRTYHGRVFTLTGRSARWTSTTAITTTRRLFSPSVEYGGGGKPSGRHHSHIEQRSLQRMVATVLEGASRV